MGEYGAEALDGYETMARHYPPSFGKTPPVSEDVLWGEVQVQKADERQRIGFRGQRPGNLGEYIAASQNYQADVLAEVTKGHRLSPRRIAGYFQFHFIDATAALWPKVYCQPRPPAQEGLLRNGPGQPAGGAPLPTERPGKDHGSLCRQRPAGCPGQLPGGLDDSDRRPDRAARRKAGGRGAGQPMRRGSREWTWRPFPRTPVLPRFHSRWPIPAAGSFRDTAVKSSSRPGVWKRRSSAEIAAGVRAVSAQRPRLEPFSAGYDREFPLDAKRWPVNRSGTRTNGPPCRRNQFARPASKRSTRRCPCKPGRRRACALGSFQDRCGCARWLQAACFGNLGESPLQRARLR